jgi:CheY-like chemotaxis protein
VKALVEAHEGTVVAESPGEGQGAVFTVRLPMVAIFDASTEPVAVGGSLPGNQSEDPVSLEDVTVLVVDDDADSRYLIAALLENARATVLTAASVREAFRLLNPSIDVLLVDIAMPGQDGYTFIRRVRTVEPAQTASIPAAAVTSLTRDEDRDRALNAGFQEHLAKPVESKALLETVARLAQSVRSH